MPNETPESTETTVKKTLSSSFGDWVFKILAGCVIPLVLWGVRLESRQVAQDLRIEQLQKETTELRAQVRPNSETLIRLDERLKNMDKNIKDIKELLNKPSVP